MSTEAKKSTAAKMAGIAVMTLSVVSVVVVTLVVFKSEGGLEPRPLNYGLAAAYGFAFGAGIAVGGYWMTTQTFFARGAMLGTATTIVAVASSATVLWTYALMVAGVNELEHPTWASLTLVGTIVALVAWAARHQFAYGRRAALEARRREDVPPDS